MGGGILTGALWGLLVSGFVLAALSLSTPLPERATDAAPVEVVEQEAPAEEPVETDTVSDAAPASEPQGAEVDTAAEATAPIAQDGDPAPAAPPAASPAGTDAPNVATAAPSSEPAAALSEVDGGADASEPVPLPAGTEFNRPPPELPAALPQADQPLTTAPVVPTITPGQADTAPELGETAPAPQPVLPLAPAAPPAETALERAPELPAPAGTSPPAGAATRPALPQVTAPPDAPSPQTAPGPLPGAAETPDRDQARLPQGPNAPAPTLPEEAEAATPANPAPRLPQVTAPSDEVAALPQVPVAPRLGQNGDGLAGRSSRLPQVAGLPGPDAMPPDVEAEAELEPEIAPFGPSGALAANAEPFDAVPGQPLIAIVLIDDPDGGLAPDLLTQFTFPVAFAIDPMRADAATRAQELRGAGFEVIVLAETLLPENAAASDLETALSVALNTMPQAVALMDGTGNLIQGNRPVLDATVAALSDTGHGLLAFPRGLNAAEETARRNDLPAATFFRMLDDEDQRATVITRYLSRAAFAAGQEGAVVVAGRTRPDTVTALFSWALGTRTEAIAIAPVSAVLQRLSE